MYQCFQLPKNFFPFSTSARYSSYESGIGADIVSGKATLESLSDYALKLGKLEPKVSGKQEYLESVINQIMFEGI
jgi:xylose isomerase